MMWGPMTFGEDRDPMDDEPEGKWRVFTDGTPAGTRVITPRGEEAKYVTRIDFTMDANDKIGQLSLDITAANITMVRADKVEVTFVCPQCSETTTHRCASPF